MSFKNRNRELKRKCDAVVEEIKVKTANKQPKNPKHISAPYVSKNQLKRGGVR